MKNSLLLLLLSFILGDSYAQLTQDYFYTSVTFPADYKTGDYIEFAHSNAFAAHASGYYEISIAYSRGNLAAAATHIASSTHSNPSRWLEAGRINNNVYMYDQVSFTVDHNPGTKAFRVRATQPRGIYTPITVDIKIRSINFNASFGTMNTPGHEANPVKLLPMTFDWDLIVGNPFTNVDGTLAIKVISNGNVGIGTANPTERLSVEGTIRAKEIKVEASPWPDYVFAPDYQLMPLDSLAQFVQHNRHLPAVTPASQVEQNGVDLGELNRQLLQKVEELTLYLLQQHDKIKNLEEELIKIKKE